MDILEHIGNTPLVKVKNIYGQQCANVWVKLEEFNAGGSIKSRVENFCKMTHSVKFILALRSNLASGYSG